MNKHLIVKRCRRLRLNQTESEKVFWEEVRNRKINNLKFLRQHPFIYGNDNNNLYYFIGDFYCADKKIIIELDGEIHKHQEAYDENRDIILRGMNLKVVRFKNHEIKKALEFVRSL
jgi:very-short-patch-repair endonuclease